MGHVSSQIWQLLNKACRGCVQVDGRDPTEVSCSRSHATTNRQTGLQRQVSPRVAHSALLAYVNMDDVIPWQLVCVSSGSQVYAARDRIDGFQIDHKPSLEPKGCRHRVVQLCMDLFRKHQHDAAAMVPCGKGMAWCLDGS
jgi:hypothetical protein